MSQVSPLDKSKEQFRELIDKISLPNSPVGIDAQYTHAIIINFLQNIYARLEKLESALSNQHKESEPKKRKEVVS